MKEWLQCTAIGLDDHLICNPGQGGHSIWDSDCLCKDTSIALADTMKPNLTAAHECKARVATATFCQMYIASLAQVP